MAKKNNLVFLTVFLIGACKNIQHPSSIDSGKEAASTKIVSNPIFILEKTACYGTCPVYKVNVFRNDSLTFEGERFVDKIGIHTKEIPKGTVKQLIKQFREANFFAFKSAYEAHISDLPTTYITFNDGAKSLKIKDYHGSPEALKTLEKVIADLVAQEIKKED